MSDAERAATRTGYAAVTVGTFDGVHLGHRRLIDATRREAASSRLRAVVVTFDRHPLATVRPKTAPRLLTSLDQKVDLLYEAGADDVVVLEFDAARANQSAEDFVATFLVDELGARVIVVGDGFRFGHRQRGDVAMLESMGASLGFRVVTVTLVSSGGGRDDVVSSSAIRELITAGDLEGAATMLGREHEVRGTIVDARRLVVVVSDEMVLPPPGEYALGVLAAGTLANGSGRVLDTAPGEPAAIELDVESFDAPASHLVAGEHASVRFVSRRSSVAINEGRPADVEEVGR